jgi:hypothetical protein
MAAPLWRPIVFVSQGRITKSRPASALAAEHPCSVPGCPRTVYENALRSGLCRTHYMQSYERKASTTVQTLRERCCVPRCPHLVYAKARVRGCCRRHYDSMYAAHPGPRSGAPLPLVPYDYTSVSSSRSEAPSSTACLSDDGDAELETEETRPESNSAPH